MSSIDRAALLLIDVQQGFDEPRWGERNNPDAEAQMARLLEAWRRAGGKVLHVRHCSTEEGSPLREELPGNAFKAEVAPIPGEPVFRKTVNSAFIGTSLEPHLRDHAVEAVVLVGLTTNHCVSTTARMAGNLGFRTYVVSDATATFDRVGPDGRRHTAELLHETALASLHDEFATVLNTDEVLAKL